MPDKIPFMNIPDDDDYDIDDDLEDEIDEDVEDHDSLGPDCPEHSHWRDDAHWVYYEKGGKTPKNAPRGTQLAEVIRKAMTDDGDPIIFRYSLVYVDEKGSIQIATPNNTTVGETINLLTRAASILAYQDDIMEREAKRMLARTMQHGLADAVKSGEARPVLERISGRVGEEDAPETPTEPPQMDGGYL